MSRQPLDIAQDIGDLTNRVLVMMQNQLHFSLPASTDENSELMQKKRCRKHTVSKHYVPPKTVARNGELQRKQRESLMQKMLHQELPHQAVEASRLNLPMPVVDRRREVKVQLPKPHKQMSMRHRFLPAVQGTEDPTKFPESKDLGATLDKILRTRPTGQTLTSAGWFDYSGLEELERIGSLCANSMCDGGMPQLRSCADSWNESEYLKKF